MSRRRSLLLEAAVVLLALAGAEPAGTCNTGTCASAPVERAGACEGQACASAPVEAGDDMLTMFQTKIALSSGLGIDSVSTSSSDVTAAPPAVGLCSPAVVQQSCGEIAGAANRTGVLLEELADAFSTDVPSSVAFLTSIGVDFSGKDGVQCGDLCNKVLEAIPEAQRPPSCDVGAQQVGSSDTWDLDQQVGSNYTWDIDLSPEVLDMVHISETPPDADVEEEAPEEDVTTATGASLLQTQDMPAKYTPVAMDIAEMTSEVAEVFRMYPAPAVSEPTTAASLVAALPPRIPFTCGREAIWDNGAEYKGCQSKTHSGKTCLHWSDFTSKQVSKSWLAANRNWCRNPTGKSTDIWCFTSKSPRRGERCDPLDIKSKGKKSAPKGFAKVAGAAGKVAAAWIDKAISKWDAKHLPKGYETWLGPSEARAVHGRTIEGCACKQKWDYNGKSIVDYCGNPDNDPSGEWCMLVNKNCLSKKLRPVTKKNCVCKGSCYDDTPNKVFGGKWCLVEDAKCQGATWGMCANEGAEVHVAQKTKGGESWGVCAKPKTTKGCACKQLGFINPDKDVKGQWCIVEDPSCQGTTYGYQQKACGDDCKGVRQMLQKVRKVINNIGFEWDASVKPNVYAYVGVPGNKFDRAVQVTSTKGMLTVDKSKGGHYVTMRTTTASDHVGERAIMRLCPLWWSQCNGDLKKCQASKRKFGELIGTIVHEAMHHYPVGADDYLYGRDNIKRWVKENRLNKNAMKMAKDNADSLQYFVEDVIR